MYTNKVYKLLLAMMMTLSLVLTSGVTFARDISQQKGSAESVTQQVDLNTASAEQLQQLPGIGEQKAHDIVAFRKQHGDFTSVDELVEVNGIGPKLVEGIQDSVIID